MLFSPATREFNWRASIASLASNGDFSVSPGVDRVITLLEGGGPSGWREGVYSHAAASSALQLCRRSAGKGAAAGRTDVDGFQHHDPPGSLSGKGARGGPHLHHLCLTRRGGVCAERRLAAGEKLLTADQGAWWHEGDHTLRLLKEEGTLLFSEIFWLPGH